jgi:hypothetical protein
MKRILGDIFLYFAVGHLAFVIALVLSPFMNIILMLVSCLTGAPRAEHAGILVTLPLVGIICGARAKRSWKEARHFPDRKRAARVDLFQCVYCFFLFAILRFHVTIQVPAAQGTNSTAA